jgi:hypothetical protein
MSSASTRDHLGPHAMYAEQMLEVTLITGEYDVAVVGEQRDVSIHDVVAPCPCAQLPDGPRSGLVERAFVDSGEQSSQSGLSCTVAPGLADTAG